MEKYQASAKYIIPLDALDLSLLSLDTILPKHSNYHVPIWSQSNINLRKDDYYYEFEVEQKDDSTETKNDTDVDNRIDTHTCYICNMHVPLTYMTDHLKSSTHKIFVKFVNIALERVKMDLTNRNCYINSPSTSMFFCETCAVVVTVNDKAFHLESKHHKDAVRRQKIIEKFLELFTKKDIILDDGDTEVVSVTFDKINQTNKAVNEPTSENYINNHIDTNLCETKCEIDTNKDEAKLDLIVSNKSGHQKSNKLEESSKTINYTNDITNPSIKTKTTHTLKFINEQHIELKTRDGCAINVKFDNFHGFVETGNQYECMLCSKIFENKQKHILSKKHKKCVSTPVKDKHCVREIDATKSHCILCNEIIVSVTDKLKHTVGNAVHEKQLQDSMITSENYIEKSEIINVVYNESIENSQVAKSKSKLVEKETINKGLDKDNNVPCINKSNTTATQEACCDVCNIVIHINNLHSHAKGQRHKNSEKNSVHYLMKNNITSDWDYFTCVVCNIAINLEEIAEHLTEPEHVCRYDTLLAVNEISIISNEELRCELCAIYMVKGNEIYHIYSKRHLSSVRQQRSSDVDKLSHTQHSKGITEDDSEKNSKDDLLMRDPNSNYHFCKICHVTVPNNLDNILAHDSGVKHKKNLSEIKKDNSFVNSNILEENNIKTNRNNEQDIPKSDSNKNKTKELKDVNEKKQNKSVTVVNDTVAGGKHVLTENSEIKQNSPIHENLKNTSTEIPKNLKRNEEELFKQKYLYVMESTPNVNEFLCKVCKVKVPNSTKSIEQHLDGLNHISKNMEILEQNRLKEKGDKFFCELCHDHLYIGMQFDHIESKSHKKNKIKNETTVIEETPVKTDVSLIEGSVKETHLKKTDTKKSKPSTSKIKSSTSNETNSNLGLVQTAKCEMYCIFCKQIVLKNEFSINAHIRGNHNSMKDQFLINHSIIELDRIILFCIECRKHFSSDFLFDHISDELHLLNIMEYTSSISLDDDNYCNICESFIVEPGMAEHTSTEEHVNNYNSVFPAL